MGESKRRSEAMKSEPPPWEPKTIDDHFVDWVGEFFSFGYGTGEPHVIPAIRKFLSLCNEGTYGCSYNYEVLERDLGPVVAWLLINRLCGYSVDIIEYGTSPRFAWLTKKGERLRDYMLSKTDEELVEMVCNRSDDTFPCYPSACNCGPSGGHEEGRICPNPFWLDRP